MLFSLKIVIMILMPLSMECCLTEISIYFCMFDVITIFVGISTSIFNEYSGNLTKWSNILKRFVGNLPKKCLSVFDHFVGLPLKGLSWRSEAFSEGGQGLIRICSLRSPKRNSPGSVFLCFRKVWRTQTG